MPGQKETKKDIEVVQEAPARVKLIDVERTVEKLLDVKKGDLKLIERKDDHVVIGTAVNDNFVRITHYIDPYSFGSAVQGLNTDSKLVTEFKVVDAEILKHIIWL